MSAVPFLRLLRRFRRDRRGSVLVEMTLIAPLMLVLSAGVFEFGNLIHQKLLTEAGVIDAARFAARCNTKMYAEASPPLAINCADVAKNIAVFGNAAGTGSARVAGWQKSDVTVAIADAASCHDAVVSGVTMYYSLTPQVCIVRVSSSKAYADIGMLSIIGIGALDITAAHEERLIRF